MALLKALLISLLLPVASLALPSYDCPALNTSIPPIPPLEPTTQAFADASANSTPLYKLPIPQARIAFENLQTPTNPSLDSVDYEVLDIPVGPTGSVNIHIFRPKGCDDTLVPALVYLHGGGWIFGNPVTHRRLVLDLIKETGAGVFFVNYTPSPEAIYPVPIEQAYAAVQWLYANGAEHGLDPEKVAFAGDSAGGHMSIALSLLSLERNTTLPLYQVLFYPVTNIASESITYTIFANGPVLLPAMLRWMISNWAPDVSRRSEVLASPLLASKEQLEGFPPTLMIVAEVDPLREEGEEFARKLAAAGVETTVFRVEGTVHDCVFLNALSRTPAARGSIELAGLKLKRALA